MRKFLLTLAALLALSPVAWAADRHVYLDTDADGQLNDCPNPSHNAKGTSNTDELSYCSGGTSAGKIIGTATGRVASGTCTGGGGSVANVTNGVSADADGDGSNESVYGHPQACVWNMAVSDSCEIHSGTYTTAGAMATDQTGDISNAGGSLSACDNYDCWYASFVALGLGPNLSDNGYGTAGSPAYIRGAFMNASSDTWDTNSNRRPDSDESVPSYPVVLSGDRDGDLTFDQTTCSSGSCSGDTYFMAFIGCGTRGSSGSYGNIVCGGSFVSGEKGIFIDTDANGSFDTEITNLSGSYYGAKNTDYLTLSDIEFTRYNGGNNSSGAGVRHLNGHINLIGDGSSFGLVMDRLYIHDNDYAHNQGNKAMWAVFGDYQNGYCRDSGHATNSTIYKNNLIYLQTARLWENDNDFNARGGCSITAHNNRVVVDPTNNPGRATSVKLWYLKPIDQNGDNNPDTPKVHRFYNNEFIFKSWASVESYVLDLQGFGNGQATGLGELWVYGNVFRTAASGSAPSGMHEGYCSSGNPSASGSGRYYLFNNTFDSTMPIGQVCQSSDVPNNELLVEKNNAFYNSTSVYADVQGAGVKQFATVRRTDNCVTDAGKSPDDCASNTKGNWFADAVTTPTYWNALTLLAAKPSGELDGVGTCDPDGDSTAGVDYDGDGVNDTSWTDIAGNTVSCPTTGTAMNIGAIQNDSGSGPVTRYVAAGGSCANHANVGTSFVSCVDSLANGCTLAKPCCHLYDANSAASASDAIEVHHGTYNTTDPAADNLCYSGSYGALKITKASTTWARASGDTPTVNLANTRHGGLYVAADGVTIDGFTIIGQKTTGNDTERCASIGSSGVFGNVTIKNNSVSWDGTGNNNCASCSVGIRMDFDETSVIENNTVSGPYAFSMWTLLPTVTVTSNTNVIVRNNTITSTRDYGQRHVGITVEGPEGTNVVYSIYKNTIKKTNGDNGASKGMYLRDHKITLYVYNNHIDDHNDGILLQDDQDVQVEQLYLFNNTVQGCVYGLRWPEAYHADVRNNYFECSSSGVRYDSCNPNNCNATICGDVNCATCDRCDTMDQVDANDTLEYNVSANALKVNAANCSGTCPEPTTANNIVGTCALSGPAKIPNSGNCFNTGMNNPVGQGANTCSASGVSCLVDYEGNTRPQCSGWDVGWDEFYCSTTITDLRCIATDLTYARLGWTAPYDADGVSSYDIRSGQAYIVDDTTWVGDEQATGEPTPGTPGTAHQMNITLPAGYYYTFHMTYTDGLSNVSARSNVTAKCIVGLDGSQPPNRPPIHELDRSPTSGYPEIQPP